MLEVISKRKLKLTLTFKDGSTKVVHGETWLTFEQFCKDLREGYEEERGDISKLEHVTVEEVK